MNINAEIGNEIINERAISFTRNFILGTKIAKQKITRTNNRSPGK